MSAHSKFIDFQALKNSLRIEEALPLLGLKTSQFSDQMRGACPACKSGGDRALVITASKQAFYCFVAGQGGDVIALVAHIKSIGMKEAAAFLVENLRAPEQQSSAPTVPSNSSPEKKKAGQLHRLNPLTYLQPEHPLVQALGISSETASHFGAGYAPKGIMRGRLAIPIHDVQGELLAYCGRALKDDSPTLLFPNGFNPVEIIFNAHNIEEGPLTLVRDPLSVLRANENGIGNVISVLTDTISAQHLEMIAGLMDSKNCESIELH